MYTTEANEQVVERSSSKPVERSSSIVKRSTRFFLRGTGFARRALDGCWPQWCRKHFFYFKSAIQKLIVPAGFNMNFLHGKSVEITRPRPEDIFSFALCLLYVAIREHIFLNQLVSLINQ